MLKENTVYFGDSFELLKQIPDNSIPLVLVDPPYKIGYDSKNKWDSGEFIDFTTKWVKECFRVLTPTGTMWSFMGYENLFTHKGCNKGFINILEEYGNVHLENMTVWARQKGRGSSKHLKSQREDLIHSTKSDKFIWNNLKVLREVIAPYVKDGRPRGWFLDSSGKRVRWTGLGNVWCYSSPQFNGKVEKQWHPAQKPIMMLERLIRLSSNEGDLVLDPFSGSGSVALACKLSGRKFLSFENNQEYFNKSVQRLENFNSDNYVEYNKTLDLNIKRKNQILELEKV